MAIDVDVIVLTRDEQPINAAVLAAIQSQAGVQVHLHRVIGTPLDQDTNRWSTIARARNVGGSLGYTPWLMFVDDDVVLGQGCIAQLLTDVQSQPSSAAFAADYLNERDPRGVSPHVAMGATLFRRDALKRVKFRWEEHRCECQCLCDDLRRQDLDIEYSGTASAVHLEGSARDSGRHTRRPAEVDRAGPEPASETSRHSAADPGLPENEPAASVQPARDATGQHPSAEILVAFDSRHVGLFRSQFIARLRASGNDNVVHAVTYGLRDKDAGTLRRLAGVRLYRRPYTVHCVARSRLCDFQIVLQDLHPQTPIAYWDAGDVLFQTSLQALWDQVRRHPDRLLVVEEPLSFEKNQGQRGWLRMINKPVVREQAFSLLQGKPVINGGFVAGAAANLLRYLKSANGLINGPLLGVGGGDQVVLNVYRYANPDEFIVIDDTWNYCLVGRSGRHCKVKNGRYLDFPLGRAVSVVHGNAGSLI